MEDELTPAQIDYLASLMVDIWKDFARLCEVEEHEIIRIGIDHHESVKERAFQSLTFIHVTSETGLKWSFVRKKLTESEAYRIITKFENKYPELVRDVVEELLEASEVNHIKEIDDLEIVIVSHSTSKQILAFAERLEEFQNSFKDILQKQLDIKRGASLSSVMTISKFISTEGKEYMERYFSGMNYFSFNDDDTFPLLKKFKTHLQKNKPAFLVRNYDLYNHYQFFHLHDTLTQSEMTVMDYIGFQAKNKFMYFIKLSNAKTLMELKRDVNTSSTYIRMFALLHQNILRLTGIHLVAIIVIFDEFEKLKDEVSNLCKFCPKYVFTEKEFSEFSNKLFSKLKGNIKGDSACQTEFNFEDFKLAMGSLFCYMATKSGSLVPNLSKKCSTQIEQAIILYPQQVAVSNLSSKRVIIQGGSGSGKTIIGKLQLKQLSSDPNNKVIYYINYGTSKGLTEEMKCFVDTINQNSNLHCCSRDDFPTNSLTMMLEFIAEKHKNVETVHVILEEFPLDDLKEEEVLSFVKFLENSNFKDGCVKIICQAMSKVRLLLKSGVEVSRTNSNQVDLLQSEADFKLNILSKSVRNTVAISKLVNIAIEMLEKESNSFTLNLREDENVDKRQSTSTKDDKAKKESEIASENASMVSHHGSELLDDDESPKPANVEVYTKKQDTANVDVYTKKQDTANVDVYTKKQDTANVDVYKKKQDTANVDVYTKKQDTGISNIPDILDAKFKYLDKPKSRNAKRNDILETKFHFKKNDGSSHKIQGKKPVLFLPFVDEHYNGKEKICLLAACFKAALDECEEHVTIIHLENKSPSLLLSSLKCLKGNKIFPDYDIKRSLDVHGLEFDNVIIYLDIGEYHMRHYFVEAMTRCKSNLVIIAVKEDIKNIPDSVFWDIFQRYWIEDLVTVFEFDDLKDVFNNLQGSYKDYLYDSNQENQITESSVISRTVQQFVASLIPLRQFQNENKEDTSAHELNIEAVATTENSDDNEVVGASTGISDRELTKEEILYQQLDEIIERGDDDELKQFCLLNNIDIKNNIHIFNASFNGHVNTVEFLTNNGADVNVKDKDGRTPLHHASFKGHVNIVEFLTNNGADVNVKDKNGITPLHRASYYGRVNIVEFLTNNGADVNVKTKNGRTPLHIAKSHEHKSIITLLESKKSKLRKLFRY